VDRLVLVDLCATSLDVPEVLVFPGLGDDHRELAALRLGCAPALRCVTVEYPDWTEIYSKPIDLDGLITHCAARVNDLVPHGSVRLAGYSFGGTMAYAVAAALTAAGRRVERLGLLDSTADPHISTTPPSLDARWRRFAKAVRERELPREICGTISGLVMRTGNARLLLALGQLRRFHLPFNMQAHFNKPITCRLREKLLLDLIERMQADRPPLDVPTVLFRSTRQYVVDSGPDLGWNRHIRSLQVIHLQGDHHTVIKPENVGTLCAAFIQGMGGPDASP
jgi:thioesterase domain-containing protein